MASPLRYELLATAPSGARAAILHTRRGQTLLPTFMPVATHAHVRGLSMDEVKDSGATICLANTYHLLLRPGVEVFKQFGDVHRLMKWNGGVLTDSGGFQIFSLPGAREITEKGARFRSPYDNHAHLLSPESSIETQQAIGSDIMMVLDVCIPSTSGEVETREAMERTHRWAVRSLAARDAKETGQAVFAIVQGGVFKPLRTESAGTLTQHQGFDGFAIGGLAVGESRELLYEMTQHTAPLLPTNKPRYLMGVGTPIDLVEAVNAGVDMFDCIVPPKMAQQGYAYTFEGQLRITRSEFRLSDEPLDPTCGCPVCKQHSRSYLRHLTHGNHSLGSRYISIHNLWHYQQLMKRMRDAILAGRWAAEYATLRELLAPKKGLFRSTGMKDGHFELVTTRGGHRAVRHTGHGEIMHPVGPWEEANKLYVDQLEVEKRLREENDEPLRILDVGLGAGTNAVAALTRAKALGDECKRSLEIVSLEHDLTPLKLALADPEGFPFLQPWKTAVEALLAEGRWDSPNLSWRLLEGDAVKLVDELDGAFDLIFFDPFSPEANPTMWTVDFLRMIHARTPRNGGVLATYSAATPTRVSLLLAGFHVGPGSSTGTKGETTIAASAKGVLRESLGERWLERWQRSSARGPHGGELTTELEAAIRAHPQFKV
ncbi:MAG: tRNA guanosine(34) transglycosylase Tgt [Archangium sp.]